MNIGCGGSWRMLDLPGAEFLDELTRRRERGAAVDLTGGNAGEQRGRNPTDQIDDQ